MYTPFHYRANNGWSYKHVGIFPPDRIGLAAGLFRTSTGLFC